MVETEVTVEEDGEESTAEAVDEKKFLTTIRYNSGKDSKS